MAVLKGDVKHKVIIVCVVAIILCIIVLIIPSKRHIETQWDAVIIEKDTMSVQKTSISLNGKLKTRRVWKNPISYTGKFEIAALEDTKYIESFGTVIEFSKIKKGCWWGAGGYLRSEGGGFVTFYTDKEFSCLAYYDSDTIVVAPASTIEEAQKICDKLGLQLPE